MSEGRIRSLLRRMAIVATMITIFLMAKLVLDEGRGRALRAQCFDKLKQIGLAWHNYQVANDVLPSGTFPNANLPAERRISWLPGIVTFMEGSHCNFQMDQDAAWDSPANVKLVFPCGDSEERWTTSFRDLIYFKCPACNDHAPANLPGPTHYVGIAGLGADAPTLPKSNRRAGVFGYDRETRMADITDGLAGTMMVAESATSPGPWTAGGAATVRGVDPARQPYIGKGHQFGGAHRGGASVLYADGSVRFVADAVQPAVFEASSTIAGGEDRPPR